MLPYGSFILRILKYAGVDLSREKDVEIANIYDTYNEKYLELMKFSRGADGAWVRMTGAILLREVAPPLGVEEEAEICHWEAGPDP